MRFILLAVPVGIRVRVPCPQTDALLFLRLPTKCIEPEYKRQQSRAIHLVGIAAGIIGKGCLFIRHPFLF